MKIVVGRIDAKNHKEPVHFVDAKCSTYDNVSIESVDELEAGEYVALVEVDWRQDFVKEIVFQTYS